MNREISFAPRPAKRQVAARNILLSLLILLPFVLLMMSIVTGCTPNDTQQVITAAGQVTAPSTTTATTIRTRVAALVKKWVIAHPTLAGWANEIAKVCFQFSGVKLPSPSTLKTYFTLAGYFVPSDYAAAFQSLVGDVSDLYTADFPAASAVQTVGTPYLTLLGQGIQDGIAAAGVTEAP